MAVDLRKIKKLVEMLESSSLNEIEISEGENSIRLCRGADSRVVAYGVAGGASVATPAGVAPAPVATAAPVGAAAPALATVAEGGSDAGEGTGGRVVTSPLVGTFYDSPSPEDKPYVTVGATVSAGDTLCVIEAMKTFNHVEAEVAGVISAIHKKSGDPVEYGEPVFVIDVQE